MRAGKKEAINYYTFYVLVICRYARAVPMSINDGFYLHLITCQLGKNAEMAALLMRKEKKNNRNRFFLEKPRLLFNRDEKKQPSHRWEETSDF